MRTPRLLHALAAVAAVAAVLAAGASGATRRLPTTGIVDIFTTLGYQHGEAAGTGMIVSPAGEVLTNNHVIRGATVFKVVDVTAHRTYNATVVGYSVSQDVAVLKLATSARPAPIAVGSSSSLRVGDRVTALGNARGRGGAPTAARGTVTGLRRSIVAYDGSGSSERLSGLIETNAPVQPGDSGGPLVTAAGRAVGMVTAGSSTLAFRRANGLGYAIPIDRALAYAKRIWNREPSADVHVGPTAFLGVEVSDAPSGGVLLRKVIRGQAAEGAGLVPGDVITSLGGTTVNSSDALSRLVVRLKPGTSYIVRWIDPTGADRTGRITPGSGPPQ